MNRKNTKSKTYIHIGLSPWVLEALDDAAVEMGLSRPQVVEKLIKELGHEGRVKEALEKRKIWRSGRLSYAKHGLVPLSWKEFLASPDGGWGRLKAHLEKRGRETEVAGEG